ncbi:hypothetical protein ACFLU4_07405, partial [Chloroflexota bacterium]
VNTTTTKITVDTSANVANAWITVTEHSENPAENTENTESKGEAGLFVEILTNEEMRNQIESVVIEVAYDDADILARGLDESSLKLYWWNTTTGKWERVANSSVDTVNNIAYGTVNHLSEYGVFGIPTASSPIPGGGGGGGGVRPPEEKLTIDVEVIGDLGTAAVNSVSFSTEEDASATAPDGSVSLFVARGTIAINAIGERLKRVEVNVAPVVPAPPEDTFIAGRVVEIGPAGSKFSKHLVLTMTYIEENLPPGTKEEELYITCWSGSEWQACESTVNSETNTITANIIDTAIYTLMGLGTQPIQPKWEPESELGPGPVPRPGPAPEFEPRLELPTRIIEWLFIGLPLVVIIGVLVVYYYRRRKALSFVTPPQTISAGSTSQLMTVQVRRARYGPYSVTGDTIIDLSTFSPDGRFDTNPSGAFDGSITSVTIPQGSSSVSFYYQDTTPGLPVIMATENPSRGWVKATQQETII